MSPTTTAKKSEAGLPARLLATWFGVGYAPRAPGTAASAAAVAIGFLLARGLGMHGWQFGLIAAVLAVPAAWAADRLERESRSRDPRVVVVDEVLGQWVALAGASVLNWKSGLGAFLLFRFFDILKPAPVRQCEALPGGAGIVADDLAAGLYAALVLWLAGCFNFY